MENCERIKDGIVFNWEVFPLTRYEASQMLTPVGCLYQPLYRRSDRCPEIPLCGGEHMLSCKTCDSIINPYVKLDRINNMWWCPFCGSKTFFPSNYQLPAPNASLSSWPTPMRNQVNEEAYNTIIYDLPEDISDPIDASIPKSYMFIIDLYQHVDEFDSNGKSYLALIDSIIDCLDKIEDYSLIGFITFDDAVNIHFLNTSDNDVRITLERIFGQEDFSSQDMPTCLSEHTFLTFLSLLDIKRTSLTYEWYDSPLLEKRLLTPYSEEKKKKFVDFLRGRKPTLTQSYKPRRCTGFALFLASILLAEASFKNFSGKVLLFSSGPCNYGPGAIMGDSKSPKLRSHHDIAHFQAPYFTPALKFYGMLSHVANGFSFDDSYNVSNAISFNVNDCKIVPHSPKWSVDIFAGSPDQIGIYEMKNLCAHTTGNIQIAESFGSRKIHDSLSKLLELLTGVDSKERARLTVLTSKGLMTSKVIAHGIPIVSSFQNSKQSSLHHQMISDSLGTFDSAFKKRCFTNQWYFNALDKYDTMAVFFDLNTASSTSKDTNVPGELFIQFKLQYFDPLSKNKKLRVTTMKKNTSRFHLMHKHGYGISTTSSNSLLKEKALLDGFNQRVWMVLLCRLLVDRIDTILGFEEFQDVLQKLDNTLIKLLYFFDGVLDQNRSISYNPYNDDSSESSSDQFTSKFNILPSMVYHLKRNPQMIRIFNSSPDETAYYHHWFLKSDCQSGSAMIMPDLYSLGETTVKIGLHASSLLSLNSRSFLIMDSIFNVIIFYHLKEGDETHRLPLHHSDNEKFMIEKNDTLQQSVNFISNTLQQKDSIREKLILRYIITQTGHSQARFMMSRLSPENANYTEDLAPDSLSLEETSVNSVFSSFKKLFSGPSNSSLSRQYDITMTDDISLENHNEQLIRAVKNYRYLNID